MVLLVMIYWKSCGTSSKVKDNHRELETKVQQLEDKIDSISALRPTKEEIDKSFEDAMWDFLEKEELADKKGFSVSQMKHMKK